MIKIKLRFPNKRELKRRIEQMTARSYSAGYGQGRFDAVVDKLFKIKREK